MPTERAIAATEDRDAKTLAELKAEGGGRRNVCPWCGCQQFATVRAACQAVGIARPVSCRNCGRPVRVVQ